jgi:hypothetical protein
MRLLVGLVAVIALGLSWTVRASGTKVPQAYNTYAKQYNLDPRNVYAIALKESGKTVDGVFMPWPWTLNVRGNPKRFENPKQMEKALKGYLSAGIKNVDIGLMQINYYYNREAIEKLGGAEKLVNPYANIRFACALLQSRKKRFKNDVDKMIASYFSYNFAKSKSYLRAVKTIRSKLVY